MSDAQQVTLPNIENHVLQIRRYVNSSEIHYHARQNFSSFEKLCISMDAITDAQDAITAFPGTPTDNGVPGHAYLLIYGLFQAFIIQQDAVRHLCAALKESLGGGFEQDIFPDSGLKDIRDLRNELVGHPTLCEIRDDSGKRPKKGDPKEHSYHRIQRFDITSDGFSVLSAYTDNNKREFRQIVLSSQIDSQRRGVERLLADVIAELAAWRQHHREQYRDVSLALLFPTDLKGNITAIRQSSRGETTMDEGRRCLERLLATVDGYANELEKRGLSIEAYQGVQGVYQMMERSLAVLRCFFGLDTSSSPDYRDSDIHAWYLGERLTELHAIAIEIDEYFANGEEEGSQAIDHEAISIILDRIECDTSVKAPSPPRETTTDIFTQLPYHFEKVREGTYIESNFDYGRVNLNFIKKKLAEPSAIIINGLPLDSSPIAKKTIDALEYPIQILTAFYDNGIGEADDACIVGWYVEYLVDELRGIVVRSSEGAKEDDEV